MFVICLSGSKDERLSVPTGAQGREVMVLGTGDLGSALFSSFASSGELCLPLVPCHVLRMRGVQSLMPEP